MDQALTAHGIRREWWGPHSWKDYALRVWKGLGRVEEIKGDATERLEFVERAKRSFIENDILSKLPLRGKKVLITAGPTYEAIDPVRFIGNHSSGKMGFELASAAANLGAEVILISGPTKETLSNSFVKIISVTSAEDMYMAAHEHFNSAHVVICAAAVADYKPKHVATQKIKKKTDTLTIELEKTKDILASLGAIKQQQIVIGFALETNNEVENAK